MALDSSTLPTTTDTVEPIRWPPVIPVHRRDVLYANDGALRHSLDGTIVIVKKTRLEHVNATVRVLRRYPIRYQDFITVSLIRVGARNETLWRNDHLKETAQSVLCSTSVSHVTDAVSDLVDHVPPRFRKP